MKEFLPPPCPHRCRVPPFLLSTIVVVMVAVLVMLVMVVALVVMMVGL